MRDRFVLAMAGLIAAAIVAVLFLTAGIVLVAQGYGAGWVLSLGGVGTIVGVLIFGTQHRTARD